MCHLNPSSNSKVSFCLNCEYISFPNYYYNAVNRGGDGSASQTLKSLIIFRVSVCHLQLLQIFQDLPKSKCNKKIKYIKESAMFFELNSILSLFCVLFILFIFHMITYTYTTSQNKQYIDGTFKVHTFLVCSLSCLRLK